MTSSGKDHVTLEALEKLSQYAQLGDRGIHVRDLNALYYDVYDNPCSKAPPPPSDEEVQIFLHTVSEGRLGMSGGTEYMLVYPEWRDEFRTNPYAMLTAEEVRELEADSAFRNAEAWIPIVMTQPFIEEEGGYIDTDTPDGLARRHALDEYNDKYGRLVHDIIFFERSHFFLVFACKDGKRLGYYYRKK
jgi:hypothetical protein